MINIETFVFNPFMENTFILHDRTRECIIIDAGCYEPSEREELEEFIEINNLNPVGLVNTHCHVDHVLGVAYLKEKFNIPFSIHQSEEKILKASPMQGNFFGIDPGPAALPDHFLEDGDVVSFGESTLKAIHVPGHSPGSLVLYSPDDGFMIAGDVLFRGSIGRSDLPGGDHDTLIKSIHDKLLVLDADTVVYPGHGQETSIEFERDHNPFLR
jgi:glyoxylase-like metal-dependent hydrolase (beta-lactamase superfamily II)